MASPTTPASRSPGSTADGLTFPATSPAKRDTPSSEKDASVVQTAIIAGNWPVVEHYLFVKKFGLDQKSPIYRALVHDHSTEGVGLFRRLLQHDLRLEQVLPNPAKAAIQGQIDATFDAAIKHGNAALVRIFLGDDEEFNRLVRFDVADASRYRSGTLLNKALVCAGRISYFREKVEKSLKGVDGFNREMHAMRIAGQHGRQDMVDLITSRLNSLRVNAKPFRAEALRSAAEHGHITVVTSLLVKPPEESVISNALDAAATNNRADVVQALLTYASPVMQKRAILLACSGGHLELAKSINPQVGIPREATDVALVTCAERGDTVGVTKLLRAGADASYAHSLALETAVKHLHAPIVKLLLAAGAETSRIDNDTLFALDAQKQREIVNLILTSVLRRGNSIDSLVRDIVAGKKLGFLTRAIEAGLDVKSFGEPLMDAALARSALDIARTVIQRGFDLNSYIERLANSSRIPIHIVAKSVAHLIIDCSSVTEHLEDPSDSFSKALLAELGRSNRIHQTRRGGAPSAHEVLSRAHMRESICIVHPTIPTAELDERVTTELQNLRTTTPEKKQLLNRARDLKNHLERGVRPGAYEMVVQIADSLVLGREQVLAKDASRWSNADVTRRRSEAIVAVSQHLLSEFDLPLISRFLTIWRLPTHQLPNGARPILSSATEWTPLIMEPYTASNKHVVYCLEDQAGLLFVGAKLRNCIGTYGPSCLSGSTRVFAMEEPSGAIVAALELARDGSGDIALADGSRWRERQFSGASNHPANLTAMQARHEFLTALKAGHIPTNTIQSRHRTAPSTHARPIELITGIPIGGSDKLIRDHFLKFCIPAHNGKPEHRLIQPQSELYLLCQ